MCYLLLLNQRTLHQSHQKCHWLEVRKLSKCRRYVTACLLEEQTKREDYVFMALLKKSTLWPFSTAK